MNKRLLLFAMVLFFMAALQHAFGQDEPMIGWDPGLQDDPTQDVAAVMLAAPILVRSAACFAFSGQALRGPCCCPCACVECWSGLHDTNGNSCFRPPENSGSAGPRFMPA
jgi:hypothetical protein